MPPSRPDAAWSLTRRLVLLVCVVALAGSLLTGAILVRALGATNRDQAAAALAGEADTLVALVEGNRTARASLRVELVDRRSGWAAEVVPAGRTPSRVPFSSMSLQPVDQVPVDQVPVDQAAEQGAVERTVSGTRWLVVTRSVDRATRGSAVGSGVDQPTVLVARQMASAVRLTAQQRRAALLAGLLGLLGGGAAGALLASRVTGPLGRLAAAARRMSAGDREVAVPREGPTEVADVGAALAALQVDLVASEQRRRAFLVAVSHELRTPMTAVAGYAEALADRSLPAAEVPHAAAVIVAESQRLSGRIDDLLALARLEADDFRLDLGPTDVSAVLQAAAAAIRPRADAAAVRVVVELPRAGPVIVTDGERLRQVVDALADNAVRVLGAHPDGGGGTVVLGCRPGVGGPGPAGFDSLAGPGGPDDWVRVEVRDSGPGLDPQDLAVAFEPGLLTERYRGSRPVGTGVGLALVGELVRRLGGRAEALAAAEGGACFAVTLPVSRTVP